MKDDPKYADMGEVGTMAGQHRSSVVAPGMQARALRSKTDAELPGVLPATKEYA
jgi:hypothetical protein